MGAGLDCTDFWEKTFMFPPPGESTIQILTNKSWYNCNPVEKGQTDLSLGMVWQSKGVSQIGNWGNTDSDG